MTVTVTCPTCGHKCSWPDDKAEARCPACLNLLPSKPGTPPSMLARTLAGDAAPAVNRTVLAQPEAMIRYNCPRCKKLLESPASFAGQKLNCPDCNQRLQIPQAAAPPPPPINKTILATEESSVPAVAPPPVSRPPAHVPASPPVPTPSQVARQAAQEEDEAATERTESCLECGLDLTKRSKVQTCPDCGSLFCSARCYREHHSYAHAASPSPRPKKPRPRRWECFRCGTTEPPIEKIAISQEGWNTFIILLILFFPLCWIGLLMTERQLKCYDCGVRLN